MKSTFFTFMQHRIEQLEQLGRFRTAETHRATLQSFILFRNGKDLTISHFNSDLMLLYEAFLKNRRVCPNTISFYMRILRAVYNQAAEKGLCSQKYPFKHVYTGIDKTVKRALALNLYFLFGINPIPNSFRLFIRLLLLKELSILYCE